MFLFNDFICFGRLYKDTFDELNDLPLHNPVIEIFYSILSLSSCTLPMYFHFSKKNDIHFAWITTTVLVAEKCSFRMIRCRTCLLQLFTSYIYIYIFILTITPLWNISISKIYLIWDVMYVIINLMAFEAWFHFLLLSFSQF